MVSVVVVIASFITFLLGLLNLVRAMNMATMALDFVALVLKHLNSRRAPPPVGREDERMERLEEGLIGENVGNDDGDRI